MKIVQTLWTAGANLLDHNFGWIDSSTHLMSWALSCLTLNEYYKDVHLYTDSNTFDIFHNYLRLPYRQFHLKYDRLICNPNLWAVPKIYTYAYQKERFLHVDGDIFISKKLPNKLNSADVVVQNKEQGTLYYRNMTEALKPKLKNIPDFLQNELNSSAIESCNMGIFGGKDIPFIKEYCRIALDFVQSNQLHLRKDVSINANIIFEQILFSALLKSKNVKLGCLFNDIVNDNGYTYDRFCDFTSFGCETHYLHIIGGYKQNSEICELIERMLLKHYPVYYTRIKSLFSCKIDTRSNSICQSLDHQSTINRVINCINNIQDIQFCNEKQLFIKRFNEYKNDRNRVRKYNEYNTETSIIDYFQFLHLPVTQQLEVEMKINPHLFICKYSFKWPTDIKSRIKKHLKHGIFDTESGIAFVPEAGNNGDRAIAVDKLCYNILILLEEPLSFKSLITEIKGCFKEEFNKKSEKLLMRLLILKLKFLFLNKCVAFHKT